MIEEDENMQLISIFPHLDYGQVYELELDKVYVWSNGYEAQIEVSLGFSDLEFYDIHYVLNRKHYLSGNKYKFQILGIAYRFEYRTEKEIEVDTTPEIAKALGLPEDTKKRTISLEGMSSFINIDSWDRDDYSFSGIIQNVKGVYISISDIKGWVCTTRVLVEGSDSEAVYDMDILVTEKIWNSNDVPKIGDDIEGSVWMQGRLV